MLIAAQKKCKSAPGAAGSRAERRMKPSVALCAGPGNDAIVADARAGRERDGRAGEAKELLKQASCAASVGARVHWRSGAGSQSLGRRRECGGRWLGRRRTRARCGCPSPTGRRCEKPAAAPRVVLARRVPVPDRGLRLQRRCGGGAASASSSSPDSAKRDASTTWCTRSIASLRLLCDVQHRDVPDSSTGSSSSLRPMDRQVCICLRAVWSMTVYKGLHQRGQRYVVAGPDRRCGCLTPPVIRPRRTSRSSTEPVYRAATRTRSFSRASRSRRRRPTRRS